MLSFEADSIPIANVFLCFSIVEVLSNHVSLPHFLLHPLRFEIGLHPHPLQRIRLHLIHLIQNLQKILASFKLVLPVEFAFEFVGVEELASKVEGLLFKASLAMSSIGQGSVSIHLFAVS